MADKSRRQQDQDNQLEDTVSLIRASRYEQTSDQRSLLSERAGEDDQHHENADDNSHQIPMRPPLHGNPSDHLHASATKPYQLQIYYGRSIANTFGPLIVLAYYLFIVYEYLERPAENDISPKRAINAKYVFFLWVILSIFLLDWAKSAIAGFEAAALMRPRLAPSNAVHLMWHLNRDWGSVSGWCRALMYTYKYWRQRFSRQRRGADNEWDGPGGLWWYLALSSLLFYIAIPLSGLSMDPADSFTVSERPVHFIMGPNQTTFDARSNPQVADLARNTWRQGQPTTPLSPTIFYAMDGSRNVSSTFFEDSIQAIYQADLNRTEVAERNITFFSAPRVGERAHGSAWGLQAEVSCSPVDIYAGLKLINITSKDVWSIPGTNSILFNASSFASSYDSFGLSPGVYFNDSAFGVSFEYMVASSDDIEGVFSEYGNASTLPIQGAYEIAMWQQLRPGYAADTEAQTMQNNPLVQSSDGYLGYGVRCTVSSDVGFAHLDAAKQTFSAFDRFPSQQPRGQEAAAFDTERIYEWPSLLSIQSLILTALTQITPGFMGLPGCLPATSGINSATDLGCSLFYSANVATGGVPYLVPAQTGTGVPAQLLQQPIIGPARMCLAAYKIFGETAAAIMAVGPGNWTNSSLKGVEPVSDIGPNVIPWQLVLAFLTAWTLVTVVPQFWLITKKRSSGSLEPFEMFRFGGEFQHQIHQVVSNEPWENKVLRQLPGMVGDRLPDEQKGFIGLSHRRARTNRQYVNDPAQARI